MSTAKITFLYINAYSQVGGIQQYNKNLIAALDESNDQQVTAVTLKDALSDLPDLSSVRIKCAQGNLFLFLWLAFKSGIKSKQIIFGHINLLFPLGVLFKLLLRKKVVLITHGIEIWRPLPWYKKKSLKLIDSAWTVSQFTRNRIISIFPFLEKKVQILYNTIPRELERNSLQADNRYLQKKYDLPKDSKILLSVCRLAKGEFDKGYDKVLEALPILLKKYDVYYIIAGKAEDAEIIRLKQKAETMGVSSHIFFTGLFQTDDLPSIYASCDVFVLPSKKEGFGIVFIEALLQNKPVIAGNKDGSVDALQFGKTGVLINPDNQQEIINAIEMSLNSNHNTSDSLREETIKKFGFNAFVLNVKSLIHNHQ